MADPHEPEPTQKTAPKEGEPVEIPIPTERDVMDFLRKTATTPDPDRDERTDDG